MNATPSGSAEVDAFLAGLPADVREALEELRRTIAAAAPEAVEGIGYGVPAFRYRGRPLVSFGAGKNHCSFYVQSPAVMDAHREELAGYDTSKGTIRFVAGRPLPAVLVTTLVRARIAETDAAAGS
ncbi:MAG TPA: DUF1801 domain-containing protein [Gaiellaceae bacterium]|nr:DUF1801 domain-containing protein [Gaiellaceae bacterium]